MLTRTVADYFEFSKYRSNLKTEVIAGITTFLAMMYIVVVNPEILSAAGIPFGAEVTATVLVAAGTSILMGLYANLPFAQAPGMGLNAYFAYTVVQAQHVSWQIALGAVFWAGIIFLLLSIFNIRTHILNAIPDPIRHSVAAGIGLFIASIGLFASGFLVPNKATVIAIGPLTAVTITFLIGFAITAILASKHTKGALIVGIAVTTLLSIPIGRWYGDATPITEMGKTLVNWHGVIAKPDFSLFMSMDLVHSLKFALWPIIFGMAFTDLFDSLSTFFGVAEAGDILDEKGRPRNIKRALLSDAIASAFSGMAGSSAATSYVESAAGIEEGGRTGMVAIVTGLLFIPFMFLSPLLSMVPAIATAPVLVLIGAFMMSPILKIQWRQLDDAIPSFIVIMLIPFSHSITQGIIWGFLSWTVIKLALGKRQEVTPTLLGIDAFVVLMLYLSA